MKHIRKLTKAGRYGFYVLIPPELIHKLNWRERQNLIVEPKHGGLLIRKNRRKK